MTTKRIYGQSVRLGLVLTLLGLGLLTVYRASKPDPTYTVAVRAGASGWGYEIWHKNQLIIDQPTIPGQPGRVGFLSEAEAQRVGNHVCHKLQTTHQLPTLTDTELRQLGIQLPR